MTTSGPITPAHLSRQALIYVRQSPPQQVLTNTESQRLQYALRQRAIECGWPAAAVEVIDADLGQSGRTAGSVGRLRQVHGIDSPRAALRRGGCPGWLTSGQVAARIGEHAAWLSHHIRVGRITIRKDPVYRVYLFPDDRAVLTQLKALSRGKRRSLTIQPRVSR